jgi:hypothetical protein
MPPLLLCLLLSLSLLLRMLPAPQLLERLLLLLLLELVAPLGALLLGLRLWPPPPALYLLAVSLLPCLSW